MSKRRKVGAMAWAAWVAAAVVCGGAWPAVLGGCANSASQQRDARAQSDDDLGAGRDGRTGPSEVDRSSPKDAATGPDQGADAEGADAGDYAGLELVVPCDDSVERVYSAEAQEPALASNRGRILRCAVLEPLSRGEVKRRLTAALLPDPAPTTGVRRYLIAYQTEREDGVAGVGTAVVSLPDAALPPPRPMVVANHGSTGLADECAPSHDDDAAYLALPWAGAGYPTIAPDYAGLGTAGVQGYGHSADTAHSVLDAARALRRALAPSALDGRAVVLGHSQGAGAALVAEAFATSYGKPELDVVAVISFAGALPQEDGLALLRSPWVPVFSGLFDPLGANRALVTLSTFAAWAKVAGEARAAEVFHPDRRTFVSQGVARYCVGELALALQCNAWLKPLGDDKTYAERCQEAGYTPYYSLNEMLDSEILGAVVACLEQRAGCTSEAAALVALFRANAVRIDATGANILLLAGTTDGLVTPAAVACSRDEMRAWGLAPQACVSADNHFNIVQNQTAFALRWAQGVLSGAAPSPCPEPTTLPACE